MESNPQRPVPPGWQPPMYQPPPVAPPPPTTWTLQMVGPPRRPRFYRLFFALSVLPAAFFTVAYISSGAGWLGNQDKLGWSGFIFTSLWVCGAIAWWKDE